MDDSELVFINPFALAYKHFSISKLNLAVHRRVVAIQSVVQDLLKEDAAEYADMFLTVLSNRAIAFYPDRAFGISEPNDATTKHHIYKFMCHRNTTDFDFLLVVERAALLWEEVDGRTDEILSKEPKVSSALISYEVNPLISGNNDLYAACIDVISAMVEVLYHPLVLMLPSKNGLRIIIPTALQNDIFGSAEGPEQMGIDEFLRDFPCASKLYLEIYYQIANVISDLDMRPKVVFDAPILDFSQRSDVDADILIPVLNEAIKRLESEIKLPVPLKPTLVNENYEMEYCEYAEFWD